LGAAGCRWPPAAAGRRRAQDVPQDLIFDRPVDDELCAIEERWPGGGETIKLGSRWHRRAFLLV
jgi:hypothetical protein